MEPSQKNEKEIKELDEWIKTHRDGREVKRALAVKLYLQGWKYKDIASLVNMSTTSVGEWKNRFIQQGIKGLKLGYGVSHTYEVHLKQSP